jgi:hypothetical protein
LLRPPAPSWLTVWAHGVPADPTRGPETLNHKPYILNPKDPTRGGMVDRSAGWTRAVDGIDGLEGVAGMDLADIQQLEAGAYTRPRLSST